MPLAGIFELCVFCTSQSFDCLDLTSSLVLHTCVLPVLTRAWQSPQDPVPKTASPVPQNTSVRGASSDSEVYSASEENYIHIDDDVHLLSDKKVLRSVRDLNTLSLDKLTHLKYVFDRESIRKTAEESHRVVRESISKTGENIKSIPHHKINVLN